MSDDRNKRIARNTLMLYVRQIVALLVSLYTVRVTLNVLGVTDYGIYSVTGGIVMLFSFLGGSMASATQRFFSFSLGQGDDQLLKKTFTINWVIYGVIAALALMLLETVGLWFVNQELSVPPERLVAAQWVYQFSILAFAVGIVTTPFTAIIIAHEDMHIYAYMSIAEAVLKLLSVFLLLYVPADKLILYSALVLTVAWVQALIYIGICTHKYAECQYRKFYWDSALMHKIIGFTGWTLFGQATTVARNQAVTILLNQVFNPAVVAARAIANGVSGQISIFSANFNVGMYPPIIKSYAEGNNKQMLSLVTNGSKITFFLMWVFALPMYLEMDMILGLWLGTVPPQAVLFTRLSLLEALINSISNPITTAARAPGRMMVYELSLGSIQIGIFIASWIALRMGAGASSVFVIAIVANVIMFFVRLLIVKGLIGLPLKPFFRHTVLPLCAISVLSALPSFLVQCCLPNGIVYSGITILCSMLFSSTFMYFLGLNKYWRDRVKGMALSRIRKLVGSLPV
jgi:O-antigen/teichoic acid export membrane protein